MSVEKTLGRINSLFFEIVAICTANDMRWVNKLPQFWKTQASERKFINPQLYLHICQFVGEYALMICEKTFPSFYSKILAYLLN